MESSYLKRAVAPAGTSPWRRADIFSASCVVVSKTHKLIYNALGELPHWPVDFAKDAFWKELVQMHEAGTLDAQIDKLYFAPTRPMFELYDLANDPSEFTNLAGNLDAATSERELKAAIQEWMIVQRDFLPLPVPAKRGGKGYPPQSHEPT